MSVNLSYMPKIKKELLADEKKHPSSIPEKYLGFSFTGSNMEASVEITIKLEHLNHLDHFVYIDDGLIVETEYSTWKGGIFVPYQYLSEDEQNEIDNFCSQLLQKL